MFPPHTKAGQTIGLVVPLSSALKSLHFYLVIVHSEPTEEAKEPKESKLIRRLVRGLVS